MIIKDLLKISGKTFEEKIKTYSTNLKEEGGWRVTFNKIDSLVTNVLATTGGGLLLGGSIYEVPGAIIGGVIGGTVGYLSYLKEKD